MTIGALTIDMALAIDNERAIDRARYRARAYRARAIGKGGSEAGV